MVKEVKSTLKEGVKITYSQRQSLSECYSLKKEGEESVIQTSA
jgi:hypothetical protein